MNKLDDTIKILMYCKKYEKEIKNIEIDNFMGENSYGGDDTHIAIYFKNGNSIGIFNTVYELNEDNEQISYTSIEEVLDFITEWLRSNAIVKVGEVIEFGITMTNDEELNNWIEEQEKNQFKVIEVEVASRLFYIENCPYAISFDENYKKIDVGNMIINFKGKFVDIAFVETIYNWYIQRTHNTEDYLQIVNNTNVDEKRKEILKFVEEINKDNIVCNIFDTKRQLLFDIFVDGQDFEEITDSVVFLVEKGYDINKDETVLMIDNKYIRLLF